MDYFRIDRMLGVLTDPSTLKWILWAGLGVLTIVLLLLMRTRWGQYKPLRKCVVLSIMAHILIAGYSTTVRLSAMTTAPPRPEATIKVASIGEFFEDPAAPESKPKPDKPWEKFADEPMVRPEAAELSQPQPDELADPERRLTSDVPQLLNDPKLPDPQVADFTAPRPTEMTADKAERPTDAAASSEAIETAAAMRRDPVAEPDSAVPELAHAAAEATPRARPHRDPGVPSDLLEQPMLPPQLSDAPVVSAPARARPGPEEDAPRSTPQAAAATEDASAPPETATGEPAVAGRQADADTPDALAAAGGLTGPLVNVPAPLGAARGAMKRRTTGAQDVPEMLSARLEPNRKSVIAERGGSQESEGAVQAALTWLANSQSADGRWDADKYGAGQEAQLLGRNRQGAGVDADMAVTGLALLAFLGAGHTHLEGTYQETVRHGLEFLLTSQGSDGNLGGGAQLYAFMYCHGMATFALAEAYGMTHDERLEGPLRKAIAYTLKAQHPTNGGWRYKAGDPQGDTSQLGWQLMALKSADLAGIEIPAKSRAGMIRYLKTVASGTHGGLASYRPNEKVTHAMTAEALVCRQLLGMSRANPASDEAGDFIMQELPGRSDMNLYYWYYGTLATFHLQGLHWDRWNTALKETLIAAQVSAGENSGSWDPDNAWGRHGGRVYSTALAALCLEVYYRYLPLYAEGQPNPKP
jgi:hypothetical protein